MTPLRIVLVYVTFGIAWILFSDRLLEAVVRDPAVRDRAQTAKGAVYVIITAVGLYLLIRRQLAARRARDEEVRTVLDGMADGVLVVDGGPHIVDVNSAAVALLGASSRHDLLVPLGELLERIQLRHPDGHLVTFEEVARRRTLDREVVAAFEARLRRFDGRESFVGISSAEVRAAAGDPARLAVAVVRDITEVKRFEEMREEFLATAAHEFKTPLAVVKAYAQLMRRRGQGDRAALDVIDRQVERLTRMVRQLLEVSRFRLGGAELRRERFDLGALLAEIADGVQTQADGRRIVVAPSPVVVLGDRDRVGHVIASLLENAVRFSPQGGDVEASLARRGEDAVVSVRDRGLGIPAERQARVFERYYRAHAGTAQDYGGLGIGLDMSREIVARHGGRIWFESAPGQGSTFFFSLPLPPPPEEHA